MDLPALPSIPGPSSASGTPGGSKDNSKRAASSAFESDNEHAEGETTKVKRKRVRAALSCTECRRKKVKCSRTLPCELCVRRNEQHKCRWADPEATVAPQPFALATEHELLKQRVAHLEAIILKSQGSGSLGRAQENNGTHDVDELDSDQGARDSDTEDAALVLEELALGRNMTRVGNRKRKIATNYFSGTSPALGFDPSMSPAMRSLLVPPPEPRRKLVLDDVWNSLPQSKLLLDYLVQAYFSRVDWAWHLHHSPTFRAEYDAFGELLLQGRRDEVDPLWVAILSMTLCLAVANLDGPVHSPLVNISEGDLQVLPTRFCDAAQSALECGDWTAKPRIRTLQAIALFCPYLLYKGTPIFSLRLQTYLGAAIRMCSQLGLHQLGTNPATMPPEDVSLPSGINSLRREIPLRLMNALNFVEYISVDKIKPSLPPALISSSFPGNYDDVDLTANGLVAPRPDDVATDTSFELIKWKIAGVQRRFNDRINTDEPIEYETTILDLDKDYRKVIDSLPTRFLPSYIPPLGEPLTTLWMRSMALQTINSRILRLHRPFMSRGYREPRYRTSTDSAIQAARQILACQQSLDRAPLIKQGFQLLTVQGAVVVILMDLWTMFPPNVTEGSDWRLISDVVPFFQRSLQSRQASVRKIAAQSIDAMALLMQAVETRRAQAEARIANGGEWADEGEVEPYGRLLKRTGASVSTAAMGLDGEKVAAAHIFHDRRHDYGHDASAEDALPPVQQTSDPTFAPPPAWPALQAPTVDLNSPLNTDWQMTGSLADFNIASLGGPEFAAADFNWEAWTALDQFSNTLGGPQLNI